QRARRRLAERLDATGAGRAVDEQDAPSVTLHRMAILPGLARQRRQALAAGGGDVGGEVGLRQALAICAGRRLVLLESGECPGGAEQPAPARRRRGRDVGGRQVILGGCQAVALAGVRVAPPLAGLGGHRGVVALEQPLADGARLVPALVLREQ